MDANNVEIEKVLKAATPGPWEVDESDEGHEIRMGDAITNPGCYSSHLVIEYNHGVYPGDGDGQQFEEAEANATLIANAPKWIGQLLKENGRLVEIEQIKQALEKATQGPWVIGDIPQGDQYLKSVTNKVGIVGGCLLTEDAHLIANSPEWLRYLIGEAEGYKKHYLDFEEMYKQEHREKNDLKRQVEELRNALEEIKTMETASWSVSIRAIAALGRSKSQ